MTQVRVLTPPGRAAIAVVEVLGSEAVALVDRWFVAANSKPISRQPIDAIRFGKWIASHDGVPDPSRPAEELVVVRTADDRIEVHCHGGVAASAAILESLTSGGAEVTEHFERPSITEDAKAALSLAATARVAGVLLDQANGALEATFMEIIAALRREDTRAAEQQIAELMRFKCLGRRLTTPWRVVLAGPPNVGKSSLINALVGYERALVYDQPGTTRDVVTATTAIGGWPVTLADTAGVRITDDPLEAAGVELSRKTLDRADIVVLVQEATQEETEAAELRKAIRAGVPVIDVANKIDQLPARAAKPHGLPTNAPAGVGINALLAAIEEAMAIEVPPVGTAVPFRTEHYETLRRIDACVRDKRSAEAVALVQSLLAGGPTS